MKPKHHDEHAHGALSPEMYHAAHRHEPLPFPKDFAWGAATSAHQVEGGNTLNDWWAAEQAAHTSCMRRRKKNCDHIHVSGPAVDHWNRFREDFDLAQQMNHNAHRLSLEWARIEPEMGKFDPVALAHYRDVLASLRTRGMKTMVTLHHFSNPQWFVKRGGWGTRDASKLFARYVEHVATELGDLVDWWITINEPLVYVTQGWLAGVWPPFIHNAFIRALRVTWHLARAHRAAWRVLKIHTPGVPVGVAHNVLTIQVYRKHNFIDQMFAQWVDFLWNHSFLWLTRRATHDFIGINYYFHYRLARAHWRSLRFFIDVREEQREASDIGWEVYPPGMADVLLDFTSYQLPIYITENGIATENDDRRVRFLISCLKEVYHAIAAGAPVHGYFHWSLLDNFEWSFGFAKRFGLVEVHYDTMERHIRPSAYAYKKICETNQL